jgi:hypothetical protein
MHAEAKLREKFKQHTGIHHQEGEGGGIKQLMEEVKERKERMESFHHGGPLPKIDHKGVEEAGSLDSGGSIGIGGSVESGGALNRRVPFFHNMPSNPIDAYHYILNMTPQQLEMKREIAAQLLGSVPSKMWGQLVDNEDKPLEAKASHYENIMRLPNTHAMARMLESEHDVGHGSGLWDSIKHVGRVAAKAYKSGRVGAKVLYDHRVALLKALGLEEYQPQVDKFAHAVQAADKLVNPLVNHLTGSKEEKKEKKERAEEIYPSQKKKEEKDKVYPPNRRTEKVIDIDAKTQKHMLRNQGRQP